jgi:hypothetical protein
MSTENEELINAILGAILANTKAAKALAETVPPTGNLAVQHATAVKELAEALTIMGVKLN